MSLYKCPVCNTYYTDNEEAIKILDAVVKDDEVKSFIYMCPVCGDKSGHGGEPDYDYCPEGGVMCFGFNYTEKDKNLPHFEAIELVETKEKYVEFSTWSSKLEKVIHLKKKEK